jgi:hypothetical protein
MSGISVQLSGLDEFLSGLQSLIEQKGQEVNDRIQEAGINTHAEVISKWPVGTPESTHKKNYHGGRSRQSFQYIPGNMECSVGSDVYYTEFVEEGHKTRGGKSFVEGRHILSTAFVGNRRSLMQDLQAMME